MQDGSMKGTARLTNYGKRQVALSMYDKGRSFIWAASLLRRNGGNEYVVVYLLCQGTEIVLKSILLLVDYDKYKPLLPRRRDGSGIGHDLVMAADLATKACGLPHPMKPELRKELEHLSDLYSQKPQWLRYGSGRDLLVDPGTIASSRVLRRIMQVIKYVNRWVVRVTGPTPTNT
jgi:hypothetical protein